MRLALKCVEDLTVVEVCMREDSVHSSADAAQFCY